MSSFAGLNASGWRGRRGGCRRRTSMVRRSRGSRRDEAASPESRRHERPGFASRSCERRVYGIREDPERAPRPPLPSSGVDAPPRRHTPRLARRHRLIAPAGDGAPRELWPGVTFETTCSSRRTARSRSTSPRPAAGRADDAGAGFSNDTIVGRETLTRMQRRLASAAAMAGVNGDFFALATGRPSGWSCGRGSCWPRRTAAARAPGSRRTARSTFGASDSPAAGTPARARTSSPR